MDRIDHFRKLNNDPTYALQVVRTLEKENADLQYQNMKLEEQLNKESADLWYEVMKQGV